MIETLQLNEHKKIGPYTDMYGHGPVTFIQTESEEQEIDENIWFCLDCGWTTGDNRTFAHTDCEREQNRVNQTWREYLESEGDYPE